MGNCHSSQICRTRTTNCFRSCFKCKSYSIDENELENLGNHEKPTVVPEEPTHPPTVPPGSDSAIELPKPPSELTEDGDSVLQVVDVDLLISENGKSHYTFDYDLMERLEKPNLVIRRGQSFNLLLKLNRTFNQECDAISFAFKVEDAKQPSPGHGTLIVVPMLTEKDKPSAGWSAVLEKIDGCNIRVRVCSKADTIVGKWRLDVDTKSIKDGQSVCYSLQEPIFILFNPWCKEDLVYLEDESWKKEFIMTDSGLIWRGSYNRLRPCPWNFGQFEKDILECSVYLLSNVGKVTVAGRADPVRVVRAISAAVNAADDNGVLVGNWSDDYSGGTPPTQWSGSVKILQQFYETKKPVKFGQCWVFSAVTTTVCRALGIPCRTVTNFSSAHDTQGSLTIDNFLDDDGKTMEELNSDSIWNFHVWNEVWMERPDLEPGNYGGWQAIDATPQEESDGIYRCGPASLAAVKRGEVKKPFDAGFVFAEVNADKVFWRYQGNSKPLKLIGKQTDSIGLFISTKAVGKYEREDITHLYKYNENTAEERAVVLKALRQNENIFSRYYLNEEFEDVQFDFQLRDDIVIGSAFSCVATARNKNRTKEYNISVLLRADSVLYTGKLKNLVKKEKFQQVIKPGEVKEFCMLVSYKEYAAELSDQCAFNIACLADVAETNFEYFAQDDFRVRKPDISISAPSEVIVGEPFEVTVAFDNPLPVTLTKGRFLIEGGGLGSPQKIPLPETVGVGQEASAVVKLTASKLGEKSITAKFYSKELNDVDGYLTIQVQAREE